MTPAQFHAEVEKLLDAGNVECWRIGLGYAAILIDQARVQAVEDPGVPVDVWLQAVAAVLRQVSAEAQ